MVEHSIRANYYLCKLKHAKLLSELRHGEARLYWEKMAMLSLEMDELWQPAPKPLVKLAQQMHALY
jgi:hypothetical protein